MRLQLFASTLCLAAAQPALADGLALKPVEEGGYVIERSIAAGKKSAHGLATVAELIPLLNEEAAAPEKIDFAAVKKLDGVYKVTVGREDGTLGRYDDASDVIIFSAPDSMATTGGVTTFSGAVVFALKIDNAGTAAAVQRFETGAITLSLTRKSL
jgi:hypothetical protein